MNKLSLQSVGDGVAEELFQNALERVLANIDDLNTEAEAKRSIVLTISFEPSEDRRGSKVFVNCAMKLAGTRPHSSFVGIGRNEGELVAVPALVQEEMFPKPLGQPRVVEGA